MSRDFGFRETLLRKADGLPLPPHETWVPRQRRTMMPAWVVASTALLVLVIAVLVRAAPPAATVAATPTAQAAPSSATGSDSATLEVDEYRFVVRALNETAYGPNGAAPWLVSPVPGVGASYVWTRFGPPVDLHAELFFGTPNRLNDLARLDPIASGTSGDRTGGLPGDAWSPGNSSTSFIVAIRDVNGTHGVKVTFELAATGDTYRVTTVRVEAWRDPIP